MKLNHIKNDFDFCELDERHLPSLLKLYKQFGSPVDTDYDYAKECNCNKACLLSYAYREETHKFHESLGFDGDSKRGFIIKFGE
jgi:hypothetical protein